MYTKIISDLKSRLNVIRLASDVEKSRVFGWFPTKKFDTKVKSICELDTEMGEK